MSNWSKERTERAVKMWKDGFSASVIANEMGGGMTRNAVIGKMSRLKVECGSNHLGAGKSIAIVADANKTRQKPPVERQKPAPAPKRAPPALPAPAPLPEPIAAPISARVALESLSPRSCRWPIGDPRQEDFCFCGALGADMLVNPPRPYCAYHAAIAYPVPQSPKFKGKAYRER